MMTNAIIQTWGTVNQKYIAVRYFNSGSRPTSGNVGSVTSESGVVENVGLAVGISLITHSIPEIQSTSGLQSAILNSGSQPSSYSVNQ